MSFIQEFTFFICDVFDPVTSTAHGDPVFTVVLHVKVLSLVVDRLNQLVVLLTLKELKNIFFSDWLSRKLAILVSTSKVVVYLWLFL